MGGSASHRALGPSPDETEQHRVDVRRWPERSPRNPHRHRDVEVAEGPFEAPTCDAVGNDQVRRPQLRTATGERPDQCARARIGRVRDDMKGTGRQQEIREIRLDDGQPLSADRVGEPRSEALGAPVVQLDRQHPCTRCQQRWNKGTVAGAEVEDQLIGSDAGLIDDALRPGVNQPMPSPPARPPPPGHVPSRTRPTRNFPWPGPYPARRDRSHTFSVVRFAIMARWWRPIS